MVTKSWMSSSCTVKLWRHNHLYVSSGCCEFPFLTCFLVIGRSWTCPTTWRRCRRGCSYNDTVFQFTSAFDTPSPKAAELASQWNMWIDESWHVFQFTSVFDTPSPKAAKLASQLNIWIDESEPFQHVLCVFICDASLAAFGDGVSKADVNWKTCRCRNIHAGIDATL